MAETKETKAAETKETKANVNERGEKMITIRLPLTKENQADVFVRVNQRTWLIKRGEYVTVPECVVKVIDNSEKMLIEGMKYEQKKQK